MIPTMPPATQADSASQGTTVPAEELAPRDARTAAIGKSFEIDLTVLNLRNAVRTQNLPLARLLLQDAQASLLQLGEFLDAAANQRG